MFQTVGDPSALHQAAQRCADRVARAWHLMGQGLGTGVKAPLGDSKMGRTTGFHGPNGDMKDLGMYISYVYICKLFSILSLYIIIIYSTIIHTSSIVCLDHLLLQGTLSDEAAAHDLRQIRSEQKAFVPSSTQRHPRRRRSFLVFFFWENGDL